MEDPSGGGRRGYPYLRNEHGSKSGAVDFGYNPYEYQLDTQSGATPASNPHDATNLNPGGTLKRTISEVDSVETRHQTIAPTRIRPRTQSRARQMVQEMVPGEHPTIAGVQLPGYGLTPSATAPGTGAGSSNLSTAVNPPVPPDVNPFDWSRLPYAVQTKHQAYIFLGTYKPDGEIVSDRRLVGTSFDKNGKAIWRVIDHDTKGFDTGKGSANATPEKVQLFDSAQLNLVFRLLRERGVTHPWGWHTAGQVERERSNRVAMVERRSRMKNNFYCVSSFGSSADEQEVSARKKFVEQAVYALKDAHDAAVAPLTKTDHPYSSPNIAQYIALQIAKLNDRLHVILNDALADDAKPIDPESKY